MSTKKSENQRLTSKATLSIAVWSIKLLFQIDRAKTVGYVVMSIIYELQPLVQVYLVAKSFDILIKLVQTPGADLKNMLPILLLLLGYNVIQSVIRFTQRIIDISLYTQVDIKIEKAYYEKLQSLGIKTLEDPDVNNKINRAQSQIRNLLRYVDSVVSIMARGISLFANLIIILKFSPILIPIIAVASIPSTLTDKKFRALMYKFRFDNTEGNRRNGWTVGQLESTVSLPEIMINKATKFLDKKYMDFAEWYGKESMSIRKKWFGGLYGWGVLEDLAIYIGYIVIFGNAIQKKITIGDVYFQTRIIQNLNNDISGLVANLNDVFEYSLQMNDAYQLFSMEPEKITGGIRLPKMEEGPELEFINLSFSYPNSEKKVIDKLNLKIKSGEKVAIVGANGAGKTTLMKLVCDIYAPTGGEIRINGYPLNEIENSTWYDNLGVLFQDYNTYPQFSVKENILIGNANIKFDPKRMLEAAENADALSFIEEYKNKFDQILSEKFKDGIRPSTGQWQKIAIARFFYRNAPMVIFDEPTAAIDAVSEYHIFNKIYNFFKHKTVLIVSHRFSTVRNADRILVLHNGKIVEDGTHDQLIKLNGKYAHSFNLQAEGYK